MESYDRGTWLMLGVSGEADVEIDSAIGRIMQPISSGDLGGVESDGGHEHRREVTGEQLAEPQERR